MQVVHEQSKSWDTYLKNEVTLAVPQHSVLYSCHTGSYRLFLILPHYFFSLLDFPSCASWKTGFCWVSPLALSSFLLPIQIPESHREDTDYVPDQWFSKCGPRVSKHQHHLLPRPAESETLGTGSSNLCFNQPFRIFWCMLRSESHCNRNSGFGNCFGVAQVHSPILDTWCSVIPYSSVVKIGTRARCGES